MNVALTNPRSATGTVVAALEAALINPVRMVNRPPSSSRVARVVHG
ncbi:MAG: hypothetical protein ACJARL_003176 [Halopseudomonas sp.]|jgi:hypothetical protein